MPSPSPLHVILHIGTEKTGTTTIQHTLVENREALRARGIYYLATPGRIEARALAAAALCNDLPDDYLNQLGVQGGEARQAFRAEVRQETRKALKALPSDVHRVVISSEHFHSRLRKPLQLTRLRRLLGPRAGSFRIVVYLRRQVDLLASYYSTELKNGGTRSLEQLARAACHPTNPYYDYAGMLKRWGGEFGEDTLTPALFSPVEWEEGNLVQDFLIRSGIAASAPDLSLTPVAVHNESLIPEGQALLLALNRRAAALGRREADRPEWRRLRARIARAFAGKGEVLPRDEAESFQQAFNVGNEAVRQRWFSERERLFAPLPANYGLSAEMQEKLQAMREPLHDLERDDSCQDPTTALARCIELLENAGLQHEAAQLSSSAAQQARPARRSTT